MKGDIIIRHREDGPGWKCWLDGEGYVNSGIVGYGSNPTSALQSFFHEASCRDYERREAARKAKRRPNPLVLS